MLESIIKSFKKSVLAAGFYVASMNGCNSCGGDTFDGRADNQMTLPSSGADAGMDTSSLCVDKDNDTFYSRLGCGTEIDCDDSNNTTFPNAFEYCDYKDNNCDGKIDEGAGRTVYKDFDEDGFGNKNITATSCFDSEDKPKGMLEGYVYNPDDCDDNNRTINPDALELCDDIDQDCDENNYNGFPVGEDCTNEQLGECTLNGSYICSPDAASVMCDAPAGIPADEICDGLDNNCDGLIDDDLIAPSRDCTVGIGECLRSGLEYKVCERTLGWSAGYFGCDAVAGEPVEELCDTLDNDCNGELDNYSRLVDCPTPIVSEYTQECVEGEWFDLDVEDCPECLDGTLRETTCCGYDGQGTLLENCVGGDWVSASCSIGNYLNVSNDIAADNQPGIDGDDLVFTSNRNGLSQVFLANTFGLEERIVTSLSGTNYAGLPEPDIYCGSSGTCDFTWHECYNGSLSGNLVAFECSWRDTAWWDETEYNILYVVDLTDSSFSLVATNRHRTPSLDGENLITQYRSTSPYTMRVYNIITNTMLQNFELGEEYPDISGSYAVFTSIRDPDGLRKVYLGDVETGAVERISGDGVGQDGYRPTIHGNDVVFVSERDGEKELYHYNIETASLESITACGPNEEPDLYDRRVAFTSERDGNREIYTCNLEETLDCCADAVNISNSPSSEDYDPSISLCKVAYVSDRDDNEEIYVHDLCEGGCGE